MQFFSLLLLCAAAVATASPLARRDSKTIEMDSAIYSRLEKAFMDAASATELSSRAGSDTRDDVNNGLCNDIVLIFARGTYGTGNIGKGLHPGVAFADALAAAEPGRVIVQGVKPYPAIVIGYLAGGSEEGADSMVALTKKAITQCPQASIIWGGYSQGAQVVHKAAARFPSSLYSKVKGIVLFGDPNNGVAFPGSLNSHVKTICHSNDPICDGLPLPIDGHLTYPKDATAAAAWVAALV